jgi:putative hemolysin
MNKNNKERRNNFYLANCYKVCRWCQFFAGPEDECALCSKVAEDSNWKEEFSWLYDP